MEILKKQLIERIKSTEDERLLSILQDILSKAEEGIIYELTEDQKKLLEFSEEDIKYGRIISEEDLDKDDSKWMS